MTSDLFLACFLACLFAFVAFGVIAWQLGGFLVKRSIYKHLPELMRETFGGIKSGEIEKAMKEVAIAGSPFGVPDVPSKDAIDEMMKAARCDHPESGHYVISIGDPTDPCVLWCRWCGALQGWKPADYPSPGSWQSPAGLP